MCLEINEIKGNFNLFDAFVEPIEVMHYRIPIFGFKFKKSAYITDASYISDDEKNKLKKFMMRYSWFRRLLLSKKQKVGFPYWVSKTDEERIQNIPQVLEQFKDKPEVIKIKIKTPFTQDVDLSVSLDLETNDWNKIGQFINELGE